MNYAHNNPTIKRIQYQISRLIGFLQSLKPEKEEYHIEEVM